MGTMFAVIYIVLALIFLGAWWRIFEKAGHPGARSLLMLIPLVNVAMVFYLAYGEWPILQKNSHTPANPGIGTKGNDNERVPCVHCGDMILCGAKHCRHCHTDLPLNWANSRKYNCPYCEHELLESDSCCGGCNRDLPLNWAKGKNLPCPFCAEKIPDVISDCPFCKKVLDEDWSSRDPYCDICNLPKGEIRFWEPEDSLDTICTKHETKNCSANICPVCQEKFGLFQDRTGITISEGKCLYEIKVHSACIVELEKDPELLGTIIAKLPE